MNIIQEKVNELWGKMIGFQEAMLVLDYETEDWPYYSVLAFNKIVDEYHKMLALLSQEEDIPCC
jgi:hypothetical protein